MAREMLMVLIFIVACSSTAWIEPAPAGVQRDDQQQLQRRLLVEHHQGSGMMSPGRDLITCWSPFGPCWPGFFHVIYKGKILSPVCCRKYKSIVSSCYGQNVKDRLSNHYSRNCVDQEKDLHYQFLLINRYCIQMHNHKISRSKTVCLLGCFSLK